MDDAKTPMIIALASIVVNTLASYSFLQLLSPYGYGHIGVALATSIVALVNFFALALLMRKKIKRLNGREIISAFTRIAIASAVMSAICWFSYQFLHGQFGGRSFLYKAIECFVPIGLGGIIFFLMAKLLKVSEIDKLYNAFARKLGRK